MTKDDDGNGKGAHLCKLLPINYRMSHRYWAKFSEIWVHKRVRVAIPYSEIWAHKRVLDPYSELDPYLFMYSGFRVRVIEKVTTFQKKCLKRYFSLFVVPNSVVCYFAMSHGSYDSNLDSKRLILAIVIRSRSWPNIDGTYGICISIHIL